ALAGAGEIVGSGNAAGAGDEARGRLGGTGGAGAMLVFCSNWRGTMQEPACPPGNGTLIIAVSWVSATTFTVSPARNVTLVPATTIFVDCLRMYAVSCAEADAIHNAQQTIKRILRMVDQRC
ncbi:MAG: hypothetical protein ABSA97_09445, partial [Verrucomicrobiia bacterium]